MIVLRACLRRWYVVLPVQLVAAWLAYGSYASVKPVYYTNAIISAAPANEQIVFNPDGRPAPRNGLLDTGGLGLIMNLAVLGFGDPAVKQDIVRSGGSSAFSVRMFPSPPALATLQLPIIMIESTSPDSATSVRTVQLAAAQTDRILFDLQQKAGIAPAQMVRALPVGEPAAVSAMPARTKKSAVILLLGVGLAIFLGVGVDKLVSFLKSRRRSSSTPPSPDGARHERPQHYPPVPETVSRSRNP